MPLTQGKPKDCHVWYFLQANSVEALKSNRNVKED